MRVRLTDKTTLELPESEMIQVVTEGPSDKPQDGWQKLAADKGPAKYAKLSKVRATALMPGQRIVTFRGVVEIESARRV
jgi:hypothetical protein